MASPFLFEQALAIVGFVVAIHNSPIPLPRWRPFSCALCTSFWLSVSWFVQYEYRSWLTGVGLTCLVAALVIYAAPGLFREGKEEA